MLPNVFFAHRAAIVPLAVKGAVDGVEEVKKSCAHRSAGLQRLGLIGIENEPGDDAGQIIRRPLSSHVTFSKTDRPEEHAAFKKFLPLDADLRLHALATATIYAARAIRH